MTSWSKYGEKNGKAVKALLSFLGHERIGFSVCSAGRHAEGDCCLRELRSGRLVGDVCRNCKRPGSAASYETTEL